MILCSLGFARSMPLFLFYHVSFEGVCVCTQNYLSFEPLEDFELRPDQNMSGWVSVMSDVRLNHFLCLT